MKLLCAYFVVMLVTWTSFASTTKELRKDVLSMLETHIVTSSLISRLALTLVLHLTLLLVLSHFSHGPNHRSYSFGSRENNFVPRCFGYGPRPHRGDRFPHMSGFPTGGSHTHFKLRHLDGPYFTHCGSRPTRSNGEVQRTVKNLFWSYG
jgi:hypothetical protein